jgi:hypothetical protein
LYKILSEDKDYDVRYELTGISEDARIKKF